MSKKNSMRFLLVLLTLGTVGFILAQTIRYPEFKGINQFTLNSVENGVCSADVDFNVYNDNWFSFKGKEIHSEIYYKEKLVAIGFNEDEFKLPKKEQSVISMNVDFFLDSLRDDLKEILMKDSLHLSDFLNMALGFLPHKNSLPKRLKSLLLKFGAERSMKLRLERRKIFF